MAIKTLMSTVINAIIMLMMMNNDDANANDDNDDDDDDDSDHWSSVHMLTTLLSNYELSLGRH